MAANQRIIDIAFAVLSAHSTEEAVQRLAVLAREDLEAAKGLMVVLCQSMPATRPIWAAALDRAANQEAGIVRPKPFNWSAADSKNTADELAAHMGWEKEIC